MKILPINKRTKLEDKELRKLKLKTKLTNKEKNREIFLSIKDLWNCEC